MAALVGVTTLVVAGACTPEDGPAATSTPTPTFTCTATVGACTPQQAEKEAKAARDHAAAKEALQAGVTAFYGMLGREASTEVLKRYFAEEELQSALGAVAEFRRDGRFGHGTVSISRTAFETAYPSMRQQVDVCEDATKFYTTNRAGKDRTPPGFRLQYTATLKLLDGKWKRTHSTDSVKVASCDA